MKIGLSLIILLVALLFAPGAAARGSGGGFAGSHAAFARPHAAAHSRPMFIGSQRTVVVHQRFARVPVPPQRPFIARHRIVVAPPILMTTPAFATPVFIVIRPVCCG